MKFQLIALIVFAFLLQSSFSASSNCTFPGWPANYGQQFNTSSGYLAINSQNNLHYVFVQVNNTNSSKSTYDYPLILWLNGGPGCSSLLGLTQENGPFLMQGGSQTWQANPYSWNNLANILYLESPVGVGYSYTTDPNYVYNDTSTANDAYHALVMWFAMPEFQGYSKCNFWIAGESYGGFYIPMLAANIHALTMWPFVGVMIGNGIMNLNSTGVMQLQYAHSQYYAVHNFYGPVLRSIFHKQCAFPAQDNPTCRYFAQQAAQQVVDVNPYDVYGYCFNNTQQAYIVERLIKMQYGKTGKKSKQNVEDNLGGGPPCTNLNNIESYFQNIGTKAALHITYQNQWQACNATVGQKYTPQPTGTVEVLADIMNNERQSFFTLIYNGIQDNVCPYTLNDIYVDQLQALSKQNMIQEPIPFFTNFTPNGIQTGGWYQVYDFMGYVKIKGAGHMVPADQPAAAYQMVNYTLSGNLINL